MDRKIYPGSVINSAIIAVISIRLVLLFGSFNYVDVPISVVLGAIFFPDTLLLLSSLVVSFYW